MPFKKPLKITDKRRQTTATPDIRQPRKPRSLQQVDEAYGYAQPFFPLFNDRRK